MEFLPEWLPNVHPLLVHFPIALLVSAVLLDGLSLLWSQRSWLKQAALALYVLGSLFALGTYFSGRQAADLVTVPDAANPVLNEHADMALYTLLYFGIYTLLRLAFLRTGWLKGKGGSLIVWLIALVGLGLLSETAEHGGELVYRYGVGISAAGEAETHTQAPSSGSPQGSGLQMPAPGRWLWQASEQALRALEADFLWSGAEPTSLSPALAPLADGTKALRLNLNNQTVTFLLPDTLASIALEAKVNLDAFHGRFQLIHHVRRGTTYNFVGIQSGQLVLGRRDGDEEKILDRAELPAKGWLTLKAVGDGRHFRGYLNGKLVLHGHNAPLPPGPAGLWLSGEGTVLISRIALTDLKPEASEHDEDGHNHGAEAHEGHEHAH